MKPSDSLPTLSLERRPEARAEFVEDLVRRTLEGRIRVPTFQRGLKWTSRDVLDLFDSIYRGLPVGSLLVWKKPAPADTLELGPLRIDALQSSDAWWVVDGQQRVASLTVAMSRRLPLPANPDDPFVVYFDAEFTRFCAPVKGQEIPSTWVPLPFLADSARLSDFVMEWPHKQLRTRLFEAGKRLREYLVPMYLVETDDENVLREIFYRINESGKRLDWQEVHDALYGDSSEAPSTVAHLSRALEVARMGTLHEKELILCLLALRGLNVTHTLAEHRRRDPEVLRGAVAEALPVLHNVLSFLRSHAGIPHLRLLPHIFIVEILTRFFALHPSPHHRTLRLLVRWVWRTLLSEGDYNDKTLRRRAISRITSDAEASVNALLGLVPRTPPSPFAPPTNFDLRAVGSRLSLLALASLEPRDLASGTVIDVADLIESADRKAFRTLLRADLAGARGPGNLLIHPHNTQLYRVLIERIRVNGPSDSVLATHAITPTAATALLAGSYEKFLEERVQCIGHSLDSLGRRMAGWGRHDND